MHFAKGSYTSECRTSDVNDTGKELPVFQRRWNPSNWNIRRETNVGLESSEAGETSDVLGVTDPTENLRKRLALPHKNAHMDQTSHTVSW